MPQTPGFPKASIPGPIKWNIARALKDGQLPDAMKQNLADLQTAMDKLHERNP